MNSQQAKKIDFPDLLQRLGYTPFKTAKGGRELWYLSPFRKEKEPSFHTSFLGGKWIWKDFGDGGGNVIDFVMRHEGIPFKEALSFLRNLYQSDLFRRAGQGANIKAFNQFSFQQHANTNDTLNNETQRELKFIEATEMKNPVIISYLENQRKIPIALARLYLKEVTYFNRPNNKTFFAFGMQNESDGFEIRAASNQYNFKSALIKRDITFVQGKEIQSKSVSIFEGMADFLSLLVFRNTDQLNEDAIIMHSVTTYNRTISFIKEGLYTKVYSFLDNDTTGNKITDRIENDLSPSRNVHPQNKAYLPYKDLNQMLIKNHNSPIVQTMFATPVIGR